MDETLSGKVEQIKYSIFDMKKVIIAFSGGVDSTILAALAHDVLGDNAIAVTLDTPAIPRSEVEDAGRVACELGIKHLVVSHNILGIPLVGINHPQRCYHCKQSMFGKLKDVLREKGFNYILEGTNISELGSYRPGMKAIKEESDIIRTPYIDHNVSKEEIYSIASQLGLSVALKPSSACLLSRFSYREKITAEMLEMVEKAESYLCSLGFVQVRVRTYGKTARIEVVPEEFSDLMDQRDVIIDRLKKFGFVHITLDLEGFRSGSMDEGFEN